MCVHCKGEAEVQQEDMPGNRVKEVVRVTRGAHRGDSPGMRGSLAALLKKRCGAALDRVKLLLGATQDLQRGGEGHIVGQ